MLAVLGCHRNYLKSYEQFRAQCLNRFGAHAVCLNHKPQAETLQTLLAWAEGFALGPLVLLEQRFGVHDTQEP